MATNSTTPSRHARSPAARSHPAFTLIEILVAISVIGVLMALLIPAVQMSREAARRTRCTSNLRQIGLALHAYHTAYACLPQGRIRTGDPRYLWDPAIPCSGPVDRSFLIAILPQAEQLPLYNAFNLSTWIMATENTTGHAVSVEIYLCPSDPHASRLRTRSPNDFDWHPLTDNSPKSCSSYGAFMWTDGANALPQSRLGCTILPGQVQRSNGCFNDVSPITFESITDGLSQTLIIADKATTTLSTINDIGAPRLYDHAGWWIRGDIAQTLLSGAFPPNLYKRKPPGNMSHSAAWSWSASSLHPGGVNGLMADGAVRFLKETIDASPLEPTQLAPFTDSPPGIWQKLISRNGGEVIDSSAF